MTQVEITDQAGSLVAIIKNLYPLDDNGNILVYSKELSDYGTCRFRVPNSDPVLNTDVLTPHQYSVLIRRGNEVVWRGGIISNPQRNKRFVEVKAAEYLWYLDKILIRRDTEAVAGDGAKHYRKFDSGTLKTAVTNVINQAATDFNSNHILGTMTVGTVENPDFPKGFKDTDGTPLTGAWTFSSDLTLQFDYHTALYTLKAFGIYSGADFELDSSLAFNFKKKIGNNNLGIRFEYGTQGNVVDYELPRLGEGMLNDITGIASTLDGTILHSSKRDESSIQTYGLLQGVAAYSDVKDKNFLRTRLAEEIRFTKNPEVSPINFVLNENAYPLGQYDIGDTIYGKITDHSISFEGSRRVVGITVSLHNTGKETIVVQTNIPRPEQDD